MKQMNNLNIKAKILDIYSSYPYAIQQKAFLIIISCIAIIPYFLYMISYFILQILEKWNITGFHIYYFHTPIHIILFFCVLSVIYLLLKGKYQQSQFVLGCIFSGAIPLILLASTFSAIGIIKTPDVNEVLILKFFYIIISVILPLSACLIFGLKRTYLAIFITVEICILIIRFSEPESGEIPTHILNYLSLAAFITLGAAGVFIYLYSRITDKSIYLAETELAKNKELNANLEHKVIERTQRIKNIETSLKKYLPKQLVETITKGEQAAEPKTERRKLTVFFSDIKGFTDLTESMEAEDMSKLLNEYLTEMTNIAHKWGGTVDKFIGDAIMIFYGAPVETPDKDNALNCVKMSIEMQRRMQELQKKWFHEGIENPLEIRIGISTGTATVGNFGAEDRLSYTVIGSQVNIASRLEGICEPNKIKISHPTWALISEEIDCTPGEKVKVKGIHREIMTHDVIMEGV